MLFLRGIYPWLTWGKKGKGLRGGQREKSQLRQANWMFSLPYLVRCSECIAQTFWAIQVAWEAELYNSHLDLLWNWSHLQRRCSFDGDSLVQLSVPLSCYLQMMVNKQCSQTLGGQICKYGGWIRRNTMQATFKTSSYWIRKWPEFTNMCHFFWSTCQSIMPV